MWPPVLWEAVLSAATNSTSRIHGPEHWSRVAANGLALATETTGADKHVVSLFALLHDSMRENDSYDPEHGLRAADLALELFALLKVDHHQLQVLTRALAEHDRGQVSDDPTIGCCWDADRLDLPRVGTTPDPRFFSTPSGRKRAEEAVVASRS